MRVGSKVGRDGDRDRTPAARSMLAAARIAVRSAALLDEPDVMTQLSSPAPSGSGRERQLARMATD